MFNALTTRLPPFLLPPFLPIHFTPAQLTSYRNAMVNLTFTHPRPTNHAVPCKFGTACTRATCPYQHPEGRVLPSSFHRGLAPAAADGAPSPHKTVTFKRPDGTPTTAAELERQVKEMEARKSEAEKAIKQAQAGKKDEAAPAVPISA